jgi:hypothetical protein
MEHSEHYMVLAEGHGLRRASVRRSRIHVQGFMSTKSNLKHQNSIRKQASFDFTNACERSSSEAVIKFAQSSSMPAHLPDAP